jgi:hypothetical protein
MHLFSCMGVLAAAVVSTAAQRDWFASVYSDSGVEIRADERIYTLYALLNAMGYDDAPLRRAQPVPARQMHSVRLAVREALEIDPRDREKCDAFFDRHPQSADQYGRYVLSLSGPGMFIRASQAPSELSGFEELLSEEYSHLKIGELFSRTFEEYRAELKSYIQVVDTPIKTVRRLLQMKAGDLPRVVVVLNLLDGEGTSAFSTLEGDELRIVVGPSGTPNLFAVAREVARGRIADIVASRVTNVERREAISELLCSALAIVAVKDRSTTSDRRVEDYPAIREVARQLEVFSGSGRPLESFVADNIPFLLREAGMEPASKKSTKSR